MAISAVAVPSAAAIAPSAATAAIVPAASISAMAAPATAPSAATVVPAATVPPSTCAAPAASHSGREERCAVIGFDRKTAFARIYQCRQNKRRRLFQDETRFLAWHKLLSDAVRLEAINNGRPASRQARYWTAPMIEPAKSFVTGDAYPRRESKDDRGQFNVRRRSRASWYE